jgi:putative salt-induced outer membrane protein
MTIQGDFMKHTMSLAMTALLAFAPNVAAQLKNQSEVSIVSTGGNTDLKVYNGKTTSTYTMGSNSLSLGGHITKGENTDNNITVESASNWDLNTRYDRKINEKLGAFFSTQYENDTFAGIKYRHNKDLGVTYQIVKTDKLTAKSEAGYRHRSEKSIVGNKLSQSQARVYGEFARQNTEVFFTKMWVEYLPNFSDSDDWQINVEPSLNFAMSSNLSIKVGHLYKYDNFPVPTLKRYDSQYTTTLIAKF